MKPDRTAHATLVLLLCALTVWLMVPLLYVSEAALGVPNASVTVRANISNAPPSIQNVTVSSPITLNANTTSFVQCNVSVQDFNNISDLVKLNVTFFSFNYSRNDFPDFNQTHYSNESCTNFTDDSIFTRTYRCDMWLNFNAQGGRWSCNATAFDQSDVTGHGHGNATVNDLIALGVGDLIDFGDLPVTNISFNQQFNVTNYGNLPINVSVYGYGRTEGDNLSMHCTQGNISIQNLRVSSNASDINFPVPFDEMMQLNGTNATRRQIPRLTILSYNLSLENATNATTWRLFASGQNNPGGECNGTVIFTAERA